VKRRLSDAGGKVLPAAFVARCNPGAISRRLTTLRDATRARGGLAGEVGPRRTDGILPGRLVARLGQAPLLALARKALSHGRGRRRVIGRGSSVVRVRRRDPAPGEDPL